MAAANIEDWEALRRQMDQVEEEEFKLSHFAAGDDGEPLSGSALGEMYGRSRQPTPPLPEDGAPGDALGEAAVSMVAETVLSALHPILSRIEAKVEDALREAKEREESTRDVMASFVETLRSIEGLLGACAVDPELAAHAPPPAPVDSSRSPSARSAASASGADDAYVDPFAPSLPDGDSDAYGPAAAAPAAPAVGAGEAEGQQLPPRKDSLASFCVPQRDRQEIAARRLSALRVQARPPPPHSRPPPSNFASPRAHSGRAGGGRPRGRLLAAPDARRAAGRPRGAHRPRPAPRSFFASDVVPPCPRPGRPTSCPAPPGPPRRPAAGAGGTQASAAAEAEGAGESPRAPGGLVQARIRGLRAALEREAGAACRSPAR
eukprot:tig00000743_g3867.t1